METTSDDSWEKAQKAREEKTTLLLAKAVAGVDPESFHEILAASIRDLVKGYNLERVLGPMIETTAKDLLREYLKSDEAKEVLRTNIALQFQRAMMSLTVAIPTRY